MFIFRFLEFVFKIVGTLFIVIFLQIPLGEKSLEEHILSFLKGSDKVELVKDFTVEGRKGVQKKALDYIQKQISAKRMIAQQNGSENESEKITSPIQQILHPIISPYMKEFVNSMEEIEGTQKTTLLESVEKGSE